MLAFAKKWFLWFFVGGVALAAPLAFDDGAARANHGITAAQTAILERANFPERSNVTVESIIARLPNGYELKQDERGLWYVEDAENKPATSYFPTEQDAVVKMWLMINGDGGI